MWSIRGSGCGILRNALALPFCAILNGSKFHFHMVYNNRVEVRVQWLCVLGALKKCPSSCPTATGEGVATDHMHTHTLGVAM